MASGANRRGSVLVEGIFILPLVALAVAFNLEIIRRAFLEVTIRHAAFAWTRDRALGQSDAETRTELREFFGRVWDAGVSTRLRPQEEWTAAGFEGGFYYRFPSLVPFPGKHHFEITRRCKFPF